MAQSSSSAKTQADFTWLRTIVYLMLVLAVIRGVIYAAVVPPWQAPDEPAQFERTRAALSAEAWNNTFTEDPVWYGEIRESLFQFRWPDYLFTGVTKQRDLPLDRYIALYFPSYGGTYSNRFSYAVMGWPLVFAAGQSIVTQLYLVRLNMVIMAAAVVLLAYLTARTIFPRNSFLMLGPPLLILFNPQHTHLLAAVNNGNLAEVLTATVLFIGVQGFMRGFSWVRIVLILLLSFAAIWTKPTSFFYWYRSVIWSSISYGGFGNIGGGLFCLRPCSWGLAYCWRPCG
ncbi:MAG: hypothetical protein HC875_09955 [Anaerolineales bacterium]|nr:hypothetical protein [Anaerolineales bacterium]